MTTDALPPHVPDRLKPGKALTTLAILMLGATCVLGFLRGMRQTGNTSYALGAGLSPVFLCLIVIAVMSIGRRFRNPRSRMQIVLWTSAVYLVMTLGVLVNQSAE
jgi:chromate transport protein ChrA